MQKVWPESIIWFELGCRQAGAGVTLKMRSRSTKSNHFSPCFIAVSLQFGQNPSIGQEIECRQSSFYSLYSVVTLKIRSRSRRKSYHFFLIILMIQYIMFGQNPLFG